MLSFYLITDAILTVVICACGVVTSPIDLWKPMLIFPAVFIAFLLVHLAVFVLFSFAINKDAPVNDINNVHRKLMIHSLRLFFDLIRTRIHIEGKDKVPNDKQFLFVCNHISSYDPLITLVALGDKGLAFISKKENLKIPIAGRYMHRAGCIPLDRENNRQAVTSINLAAERIKSGMCAIGIYPEGWVNLSGRGLKEFRNGAFKIAKKAKAPIVVAVVENTRKISDHIISKRKDVFIKIIDVIDYERIASLKTNEISEYVYSLMSAKLTEDKLD